MAIGGVTERTGQAKNHIEVSRGRSTAEVMET